jgi:hypothetical protein
LTLDSVRGASLGKRLRLDHLRQRVSQDFPLL